jgi:hypothetical protein
MYYNTLLIPSSDALSAAVLGQQGIKNLITGEAASNTQTLTNIDSQLRSNHHIQQDQLSVLGLIASQIQDLNDRLISQAGPTSTLRRLTPHIPDVQYARPVRGTDTIHAHPNDPSILMGSSNQNMTIAVTRSHPSVSLYWINDTLDNLSTEVEATSRFVMASVLVALRDFLLLIPQILVFTRMMRALPRAIALMRQDSIRFEDALGRVQNLQFQHFRNWKVFEAMVQCNFEGIPGYRKILKQQYLLTCPRLPGQQLVPATWGQFVFPGMTVVMAINVNGSESNGDSCPRCSSCHTSSWVTTGSRCSSCGLVFSRGSITAPISAASAMCSESSSGYDNVIPHNGRTRSDMSTKIADEADANPDDKSTDAEDETENLKTFKRIHMLQMPHSSAPPREAKIDRNDVDRKNQPGASTETIGDKARRLKAKTERTQKLYELLRFSQTFKLKTPMPRDLITIITKDPTKQAQLAQLHEERQN